VVLGGKTVDQVVRENDGEGQATGPRGATSNGQKKAPVQTTVRGGNDGKKKGLKPKKGKKLTTDGDPLRREEQKRNGCSFGERDKKKNTPRRSFQPRSRVAGTNALTKGGKAIKVGGF